MLIYHLRRGRLVAVSVDVDGMRMHRIADVARDMLGVDTCIVPDVGDAVSRLDLGATKRRLRATSSTLTDVLAPPDAVAAAHYVADVREMRAHYPDLPLPCLPLVAMADEQAWWDEHGRLAGGEVLMRYGIVALGSRRLPT